MLNVARYCAVTFITVCISTETPTPTVTPPSTSTCPKCGVNKKNGKRSCCLRGGAWFKQCGDPGGKKFHTWSEGIETCKGKLIQYANLSLNVAVYCV